MSNGLGIATMIILFLFSFTVPHTRFKQTLLNLRHGRPWNTKDPCELPNGRWRPQGLTSDKQYLTPAQAAAIRQLQSIGYLAGSQPAPRDNGVTVNNAASAYPGLNLVVSGHAPEAYLMDLAGNTLHTWSCNIFTVWPNYQPSASQTEPELSHTFWRRARLLPNGELLAIYEGIGILKLDKDSRIIWALFNESHHDLDVAEDGRIYVLTRKAHINPEFSPDPILEDFVSIISPDGELLKEVSILHCLASRPDAPYFKKRAVKGDFLHTNTIELLSDGRRRSSGIFPDGSILLAVREMDLVCVIEIERETVVWAEDGLWGSPHSPTLLENGQILVLNNMATMNESNVFEVDPATRICGWEYDGTKEKPFFTPSCGSCQRLPNGNTLITESDAGRAFEVLSNGDIVWEYINPHRAGKDNELIATLFDVIRLPQDESLRWLDRSELNGNQKMAVSSADLAKAPGSR